MKVWLWKSIIPRTDSEDMMKKSLGPKALLYQVLVKVDKYRKIANKEQALL